MHVSETFKVPFSSDCELICIQPISTSFPYLIITAHAFMVLTKAYNYSQTVHLSDCCSFRSAQSYEAINEAEERMNKMRINQINHFGHSDSQSLQQPIKAHHAMIMSFE